MAGRNTLKRRSKKKSDWRNRLSKVGSAKRNIVRRGIANNQKERENLYDSAIDSANSIIESLDSITSFIKKSEKRVDDKRRLDLATKRNRKVGNLLKGAKNLLSAGALPAFLIAGSMGMFDKDEAPVAPQRKRAMGKLTASSALDANVEEGKSEKSTGKEARNILELFNLGLSATPSLNGVPQLNSLDKEAVTQSVERHESKSLPIIVDSMDVSDLASNENNWKLLAKLSNENEYARLLNLPKGVRDRAFKKMLLSTIRNAMANSGEGDSRVSDFAAAQAIQLANAKGNANFKYALANLLSAEGGYHPNLDGANVYRGIDRGKGRAGERWKGWDRFDQLRFQYVAEHPGEKDFPINTIVDDDELNKMVADFYKTEFWDKNELDKAPNNILASLAFDFLVNSGNDRTVRTAAGKMGLAGGSTGSLLASVPFYKWDEFADLLLDQRLEDYRGMKNWDKYATNWTNRVNELRGLVPEELKATNGVQLAQGGTVDAIAGEAGPELVLPLNPRGGEVLANAVKRTFEEAIEMGSAEAHGRRVERMTRFFENEFLPELKRRFAE